MILIKDRPWEGLLHPDEGCLWTLVALQMTAGRGFKLLSIPQACQVPKKIQLGRIFCGCRSDLMESRLFRDSRGNICMLNFYPGTIIHFQTHKIPSQMNVVTSGAVNSNGDIMLFPAGLSMLSWCWVPSCLQLLWLLPLYSLSPLRSEAKGKVKLPNLLV